ncbi:MAG TPA: type IX secretion system membrane protein PorP/SprF [Flavobacteriia bacterium]|jgi:type IX secretion system PorP/SprF family membrane protein|nr:type IX secretion system membrane protein PorP/SprF [Flavobacteriia bacterium]
MKKLLFISIVALTMMAHSQELKLSPFSQYLVENPFVISPAYAGIDDVHKLRLSGVAQWLGLKDAPNTQTLSYDTRFSEKSGAGIILYNDKNGNTKQIGVQLSYAYHLILNDLNDQYLSFGLSYKFNHFKIDTDNFDNGSGPIDPNIDAGKSTSNHNFEVGFLYRIERYFISFNASNILNKNIKIFDESEPVKLRNYYLYTGYTFESKNGDYEYEPSLYLKYFEGDGRSVTDINFKARRLVEEGYIWAGISARFINDQSFEPVSISPLIGYTKRDFYVGYGFQLNINEASAFNSSGTHLLTLGYNFASNRNGPSWFR